MRKAISIFSIFIAVMLLSVTTFAGDQDDVLGVVAKAIDVFNKQDYATYFSSFVEDHTAFRGVGSPLRQDAAAWKDFIEGTAALEYVKYHQQDELVQIYNGSTAVVTAYFTFTWKEKGGAVNNQSGRASMVLVKQDGKWMMAHMHFSKMF